MSVHTTILLLLPLHKNKKNWSFFFFLSRYPFISIRRHYSRWWLGNIKLVDLRNSSNTKITSLLIISGSLAI